MPKSYMLDKVVNVFGRIRFNYLDGYDENKEPIYYIARLEWCGKGMNGGAQVVCVTHKNIGASQNVPFTP